MAQSIGINCLLGAAPAGAWTRPQSNQSHLLHVPLDGLAINNLSFSAKLLVDTARTIEGPSGIDLVNAPLDGYFLGGRPRGLVVEAGPRDRKQIRLYSQRDFVGLSFQESQSLTSAQGRGQIFF